MEIRIREWTASSLSWKVKQRSLRFHCIVSLLAVSRETVFDFLRQPWVGDVGAPTQPPWKVSWSGLGIERHGALSLTWEHFILHSRMIVASTGSRIKQAYHTTLPSTFTCWQQRAVFRASRKVFQDSSSQNLYLCFSSCFTWCHISLPWVWCKPGQCTW